MALVHKCVWGNYNHSLLESINPGGASDVAVERMCGEEGSETADAGAPSTIIDGKTPRWRSSCRYLKTVPVLSQRAVAVEIVLYKAHHIYM